MQERRDEMAEYKPSPEFRKFAKKRLGISGEQVDNLTDVQWNILRAGWLRHHYRMVAEVINVQDCCSEENKVGQKYVFSVSGRFLPEESTATHFCLWAMAPMLKYMYVIYERLTEGLAPSPRGYDGLQCTDVGIGCGGLGRVNFRVYCEPVPGFEEEKPPWAIELRPDQK